MGRARDMSAPIVEHFSVHRPPELPSFRSLCNALKAVLIDESFDLWLACAHKPLASVLDLCCGRGGDLLKWAQRGQKLYVGLDATPRCVEEAERRLRGLCARGVVGLSASFYVCDARRDKFPCADGSVDIASVQFGLQYLFGSEQDARHAVSELRRCMSHGGVLSCIYPDGDRVRKAISEGGRFGHFGLTGDASSFDADPPFGISYSFSLGGSSPCEEYAVSTAMLESMLREHGFVLDAGVGGTSVGAQSFFREREGAKAASEVLAGRRCSETDWTSLALFRVLIARVPADGVSPPRSGRRGRPRDLAAGPSRSNRRPRTGDR